MAKSLGNKNIKVRMPDEGSLDTLRTILAYEATMRGRKLGQTLCELVFEAANVESYPPEVRERLDEIARESQREHIENFLKRGDDL